MSTAYIMIGLPGAGKSTYINKNLPNIPIVSRDRIRAFLGYTSSEKVKTVLSREAENEVTKTQYQDIDYYCAIGKDFVVDGMNSRKIFRQPLIETIRRHSGIKIIFIHIMSPLELCIKRRNGQIKVDSMHFISDHFDLPEESEYDEILTIKGYSEEN